MNVALQTPAGHLPYETDRLLGRMLSPLCGMDQEIGWILRSREGPRFVTMGAELTGVHMLLGQPKPKPGSYHIGGCGIFPGEAFIRSLGESVERYSQLVAEVGGRYEVVFASYDEIVARGEPVVSPAQLTFYSSEQLARADFPFQGFDTGAPLGWVRVPSLCTDREIWTPAQLLFVGYGVRRDRGEPWLYSAVTTGSAAHTDPSKAFYNALLELMQLDSAMGHWYSHASALRIVEDERTRPIERLIERHFSSQGPRPRFHWIPNADLPGMTVACVLESPAGSVPAVSVGIASGVRLLEAMYKALIEAIGIFHLSILVLMDETVGEDGSAASEIDPLAIFDLNRNVGYYAMGRKSEVIDSKFPSSDEVAAAHLPPDSKGGVTTDLRTMIEAFRRTNKELVFCDLTCEEARQLGFTVVRVWSPDTLSLCPPSAAPTAHGRFRDYGGVAHEDPHPYP